MSIMKKLIIVAGLVALSCTAGFSQIYMGKKGGTSISFFSAAPLENIQAENKTSTPVYNTGTGDIQIRVSMEAFKFPKATMEEHFNENYVESDKFPYCTFKGKVDNQIDLSKDGEHKVTVTGTMELHGVTKNVTIEGTITKSGDEIRFYSKFKIKVADYNIKVPSMYIQNIAEVVDVTIKSTLEPYKK